jgi:hypothetical protein
VPGEEHDLMPRIWEALDRLAAEMEAEGQRLAEDQLG